MEGVDPEFFERLNHSRIIEGDPIFNGSDFTKVDYYDRFPTIYHLRTYLMEADEKADLRLVYLAMHNIVKHRGNFLREEEKNLRSEDADPAEATRAFYEALDEWCLSRGMDAMEDGGRTKREDALAALLRNDEELNRSALAKEIVPLVSFPVSENLDQKKITRALSNAMLGLAAEFKDIFGEFPCEKTKVSAAKVFVDTEV